MTTEFTTSRDGTRIAFERSGTGPAVVLVDGALCYRDFGPARDLAAALASEYTVFVYDRRGRGESGDTLPFAPEREIDDLTAVIEAAGGDVFVMGQSSGGGIALEAAAAGVPMRKLAVYEAPYVGVTPIKGRTPDYLADLNALLSEGKRDKAVGYFMVRMVGAPAFMPVVMRLMPTVFAKLQSIAHTLPYDTQVMNGFTVPADRLSRIGIPTLVMGGSKGAPAMKAGVRAVAKAIPDAVETTLAKQTHQVSPAALAPELLAFFR